MEDARDLWSESISRRLNSARVLDAAELAAVHAEFCEGCPVEPWPYGNATSINPLLVTLGASPGSSPARGVTDPAGKPLPLPPAGIRHPHPQPDYLRRSPFWRKLRWLACTLLQRGTMSAEDAFALFGNMNLDPHRSSRASEARMDAAFGTWVLRTIRDRLQPRIVICLGLRNKPDAMRLLADELGFEGDVPGVEYPMTCYQEKRYTFREWDCVGPAGNELKVVQWPQHPSRAPFTNRETWRGACREFAERNGQLLHQ